MLNDFGLHKPDTFQEYGKVFGFQECMTNVLVTGEIDMVHEIFAKQFDNFYVRRALPIAPDADKEARILAIVGDSASETVKVMEARHADGATFNIKKFFMEFTMDTIARLVMGQQDCLVFNNPRVAAASEFFNRDLNNPLVFVAVLFPSMAKYIRHAVTKFRLPVAKGAQTLLTECENAVKTRLKEREENGRPESARDYIDLFLDSAADFDYENKEGFSNTGNITKNMTVDEIVAQATGFLLAGFDTTSNALGYTAWMLAHHPEAQRRCQEEIDSMLADGEVTYESLNNLRYLDAVCKEILRFYPLGAKATPRWCMKSTTVGGIEIEAGTIVMPDVFGIHFDKKIWGEDAEEFLPERWLDPERRVPAIAYLPFGAGPRVCIGMRLALLEEKVMLTQILQKFDILTDQKVTELKLVGSLTISPEEVPVRIQRRA